MSGFPSFGHFPALRPSAQRAVPVRWSSDPLPPGDGPFLPRGEGRSYGDSCLNEGGTLLLARPLSRFLAFDPATGVLTCEAGVTLDEVLRLVVPQGWFLSVTPGTKFVSVGGAIANDVHGKNHHRMGTFGCHVRRLELLRSDGSRRVCSPAENADWFGATIGGLGLTGLITWAELQLVRMNNPFVRQEVVRIEHLEHFLEVSRESERDYVFTVGWVDCLARGRKLGRGVYYRGNQAAPQLDGLPAQRPLGGPRKLAVPFHFPSFTVNRLSVALLSAVYPRLQLRGPRERLIHYEPFFYPLDGVHHWNRVYGRKGFLQFQCVVPQESGAIRELLDRMAVSGQPSFLTVLKTFGSRKSPGWLSFPRPGITLAVDFANHGERTRRLFAELERVTREAGGAMYPAKDALMSPESFAASYPELGRFKAYVDPAFSSSFWRRVTEPARFPIPGRSP